MIYFAIIFLLILLIYHYDYQDHSKDRLQWYVACCIILILLSGLRYRLGIDSTRYDYGFIQMPSLSKLDSYNYDDTRYGVGYIFLNSIARTLSDSFVMMQFLHAIFINSLIFLFFYRNTKHIFFATFLYFLILYFNYNCEILRESCAIVVFLFAWKYFKTDAWLKYYIYCVIAVLFHPSALLTLLFPIFYLPIFRYFFRMNWIFGFTCVIVFVIAGIISIKFFDLIQLISLSSMEDYAETYRNSSLAESKSLNIIGICSFFLRSILYPFVAIVILKRIKNKIPCNNNESGENEKLEYMICWYTYISIITLFISLFYRFNNYLMPFTILVLADVVFTKVKISRQRVLKLSFVFTWFLMLPYLAINIYGYLSDDNGSGIKNIRRYYPYASVLDPYKDAKREQLFRYLGGN